MIVEPSVACYRVSWLMGKLGSAHLAVLALAATPGGMVSEMLRDQLLDHVDAAAISERRGASRLVVSQEIPPTVAETIDFMEMGWTKLLGNAFATLQRQEDWALWVIGRSQKDANVITEVIVKERTLHDAMVDFAWRIFYFIC